MSDFETQPNQQTNKQANKMGKVYFVNIFVVLPLLRRNVLNFHMLLTEPKVSNKKETQQSIHGAWNDFEK